MKAGSKNHGWVYRRTLATVTALAILTGLLWIGSYFIYITVAAPLPSGNTFTYSAVHGVAEVADDGSPGAVHDFEFKYYMFYEILVGHPRGWWSWSFVLRPWHGSWMIEYPLWFPCALFSVWPAWVYMNRTLSGSTIGLCPSCGYDLRGSAGSVTCSECGESIAQNTELADGGNA